ncbi:unnamed protein product [Rotaria sp. Silwood1]|nr:unnamed protein product [Rotaria sp. Silwood1]
MNLSERTAEFLWSQLFNDVILRFPPNNKAKQQMIKACRDYYRDNQQELQLIDEFEKYYTSEECIRWYTRETFVYKMVNKALRTEDVEQLHTFRFFIADLSSALASEHKKMIEQSNNGMIITTVYRGVRLTLAELEEFRSNEGKLISINGYLSTSRSRCIAINFAVKGKKQVDSVPVLFEIECQNEESACSIFADITSFSDFPDEQEVLFDLGAVFKIQTVSEEDDMWKTCLPEDHSDIANVLHNIADCYQSKGQYDKALQHYHLALSMKTKCFPSGHPEIATTLNNISTVLSAKGDKVKALELCLKALKMRERVLPFDHLDLATSFSSAGHKYEAIKEYQCALEYFEKALRIRAKFLSEDDPVRKRTERHVIRMKWKVT